MLDINSLAYLTPDLPGSGGVLKDRPEDFLVEEQPLYEPSGEGEHLYLFIEKRQATTPDVARRLAKAFRIGRRDVGYAGLKDKHAVTRQHFSIWRPGTTAAEDAEGLERFADYPYAKVLWVERHGNKLRRGHHGGNRFIIRLRDVEPATAALRARPILDRLAKDGLPNYFGAQRFGYRQNSHLLGAMLLKGDWQNFLDLLLGNPRDIESPAVQKARAAYDAGSYEEALEWLPRSLPGDRQALDALRQKRSAKQAVLAMDVSQREFLISAAQSAVFNAVLDARLRAGTFSTLLAGDLAWKHDNRACFAVDERVAAQENGPGGRVASLEVSPSGPSWGKGMTRAGGEVDALELRCLHEAGLSEADFDGAVDQPRVSTQGGRRPLREKLVDPDLSAGVDEHGPYLRVAFELSRGSFATIALREITK